MSPGDTTNFRIELIHDLQEAEKIWRYFFPHPENIYQKWEYMVIFYEAYKHLPHFYVAYRENTPIACLPLEWIEEKGFLGLFGTRSYVHYLPHSIGEIDVLQFLISQLKLPLHTETIAWEEKDIPKFLKEVDIDYSIDLRGIADAQRHIEKFFSPDSRRNMLKHIRNIEALGVKMSIGTENDLEFFFEQNKKNFADASAYNDIRRQNNIRLFYNSPYFESYTLRFSLENEIVAVQYIIQDNGIMYHINGGVRKDIVNLGKFTIAKMIDFSIEKGCHTFNPGPTDLGWKSKWSNIQTPLYRIEL